jgi:hypothetical protein
MKQPNIKRARNAERSKAALVSTEVNWKGLFATGAISAAVIVLIYLAELIVVLFKGFPPTTVEGWFSVLQSNRSIGLMRTFAPDIIAIALKAPLYLALYFLLRQVRNAYPSLILAVTLAFIGMAVYFATNTSFSMLSLSDQMSTATSEAHRSQTLAAGQALFSIYNGTGPFVAFAFFAIAGILLSIVMLESGIFGKTVAIIGIVGNALELGLPPEIESSTFLKIDPVVIAIGGVLIIIWNVFIASKLLQKALERQQ